jgi:hypothetical protein
MEQLRQPVPVTASEQAASVASLDAVWTNGADVEVSVRRVLAEAPDRQALLEAILSRLMDDAFGREALDGRSRRAVYVEAVLMAGYPWALQLEASDVAAARERVAREASEKRRPFVRAAVAGITLGLLAGLAFAAWAAAWPVDAPEPPAIEAPVTAP